MMLDHDARQAVGDRDHLAAAHAVLEAREGRLRGQGGAGDRIAADHELVDHVVRPPRGVVAVGVAARQPEDALPHQLERLVPDLARLAVVVQTRGHALGEPQVSVDRLQQDQTTVRAGVGDVERRDHRLAFCLESEGDLRYTGCGHRASSARCMETLRHRFYSTCGRLGGSSLSSFVNNPG